MNEFAGGAGGDCPGDRLHVQGLEGKFVFIRGDDATYGVWGDNREELSLKSLLEGERGG